MVGDRSLLGPGKIDRPVAELMIVRHPSAVFSRRKTLSPTRWTTLRLPEAAVEKNIVLVLFRWPQPIAVSFFL